MRSQIKNLFYDPAGLFVDGQRILDLRVPLVAQGDVSKGTLSSGKLGVEGSLDFPAGIFGIPFVEQVLNGTKSDRPFSVSSFSAMTM